ncbi:hypothetical protein AY600_17955 [Phormidium willei BDU 130791]|nr:hypothetical protein AY600_17955 [Phormidium willei BDU 130791]
MVRFRLQLADIKSDFDQVKDQAGSTRYDRYMDRAVSRLHEKTVEMALNDPGTSDELRHEILSRREDLTDAQPSAETPMTPDISINQSENEDSQHYPQEPTVSTPRLG